MSDWQPIETAPQEEVVLVSGKHKDGTPWFNIGSLWGDEWDGVWMRDLQPTHWMPIPEPPEQTGAKT